MAANHYNHKLHSMRPLDLLGTRNSIITLDSLSCLLLLLAIVTSLSSIPFRHACHTTYSPSSPLIFHLSSFIYRSISISSSAFNQSFTSSYLLSSHIFSSPFPSLSFPSLFFFPSFFFPLGEALRSIGASQIHCSSCQ